MAALGRIFGLGQQGVGVGQGLRRGRLQAEEPRARGNAGGVQGRAHHAEHVHQVEGRVLAAQRGAAQKRGPDAAVDAETFGVQAEAQHGFRRGGQQFCQQAARQAGRQVDDPAWPGLLADAPGQIQQGGRRRLPVAVQRGHELCAGQGPGRVHMAQQRQGGGEIVQADQAHAVAAVVQVLNQGLALQQIPETGKVEKQNVSAHAVPPPRLRPGRCARRRPACSGPGSFPAGSGYAPPPAPRRWRSRTARRAVCRHC